jgi:hypothetical protein
MKTTVKLAVITLIAAVATHAEAASGITNLTQNVSVRLQGVSQGTTAGTVTKFRVTNKDIIAAAVPGSSARAKLALQTDVATSNSTIVVIEGTTVTDIGANLSADKISDQVTSVRTARNGLTSGVQYSITRFVLSGLSTLSFDVQGFTTDNYRDLGDRAGTFLVRQDAVNASVAGTGTVGGAYSILNGAITTSPGKITHD